MGNSISGLESNDFPGSTVMDLFNPCGDLVDVVPSPTSHEADDCQFLTSAEGVCAMSPTNSEYLEMQAQFEENEYEEFGRRVDKIDVRDGVDDSYSVATSIVSPGPVDPTSALFAKALVNEVTNNPETMLPKAMVERERKLLKAQNRARSANKNGESKKAVGAPGGVGQPTVIGSIAHALTGTTDPVSSLKEAFSESQADTETPHTVTIGLCLTQRSLVGHPDTITRQTAFDFNELQDREYNFVSNTDSSGWRAGGGEPSGSDKVAAVDKMHIPIITIRAGSPHTIDAIIEALARGELFIPHMSIMPQSLSVDGVSPPDLSVRFGTERNEDIPPEQWPNWCLEFMHNQLYEYFEGMGACWSERPYSITLAKQVRWKTVKHMNQYLSKAGNVIDTWREKGPQYLNPQLTYLDGSSVPEEVARPHGIYLFRDGEPTNYFAPNFSPPYSTNMTRNLLLNVLNKSWDKQRREWTSEPVPPLVTPSMLVSAVCGCTDSMEIGYMANEVTLADGNGMSTIPNNASIRSVQTSAEEEVLVSQKIETLASVMTPKERSQTSSKVETSISPLEKRLSSPNVETVTSQEGDEQSVKEMGVPQPPSLEYDYEDLLLQEETSISTAHEGKDDDKEKASSHMKKASGHNAEELAKEALKSAEIDDSLSATKNASSTNFGTSGKALASDEDWFDDFGEPIGVDTPKTTESGKSNPTENDKVELEPNETTLIEKTEVEEEPETNVEIEKTEVPEEITLPSPVDSNEPESVLDEDDVAHETTEILVSTNIYTREQNISETRDAEPDNDRENESILSNARDLPDASIAKITKSPINDDLSNIEPTVSLEYSVDSTKFTSTCKILGDLMEDELLPHMDSEDSAEMVPSDEDLYNVGWAKALDTHSGTYYYFTLDRSQVVWDNPLRDMIEI